MISTSLSTEVSTKSSIEKAVLKDSEKRDVVIEGGGKDEREFQGFSLRPERNAFQRKKTRKGNLLK